MAACSTPHWPRPATAGSTTPRWKPGARSATSTPYWKSSAVCFDAIPRARRDRYRVNLYLDATGGRAPGSPFTWSDGTAIAGLADRTVHL